MMIFSSGLLLICLCSSSLLLVQGNTSVSLSLSSSLDDKAVFSGAASSIRLCPNSTISLEFLCVAENSTEVVWRNNGTEIINFHIRSEIPLIETISDIYTVYLDNNTVVDNTTSTFRIVTSRLLVRIVTSSGHQITNRIECLAYRGTDYIEKSITINYDPIDPPPKPMGSQFNVSVIGWESSTLKDDVNITFTPDDLFSSVHHVSMYNISVIMLPGDNDSNVTCPTSCYPNDTCVCTGVLARSGVNVSITAINCEDQEGPPLLFSIKKCQSEDLGTVVNQNDSRCHTKTSESITSVEIPNGIACLDGLIEGSIATYQCDEGYDLNRHNQVTCQIDGDWLGDRTRPMCELIRTTESPSSTAVAPTSDSGPDNSKLIFIITIVAISTLLILIGTIMIILIVIYFKKRRTSRVLNKAHIKTEEDEIYNVTSHNFGPKCTDIIPDPSYDVMRPSRPDIDQPDISEYASIAINPSNVHSKSLHTDNIQQNGIVKELKEDDTAYYKSEEPLTYSVVNTTKLKKSHKHRNVEVEEKKAPPPVPEQTTEMMYTNINCRDEEQAPPLPPQTVEMMYTAVQKRPKDVGSELSLPTYENW